MKDAEAHDEDGQGRRVFEAAGVLFVFTLASRVLGLVRDIALAQLLGGMAREAFLFAWTIPNLFRRLFGEGALSAAFIPAYSARVEAGDDDGAARLAGRAGALLILALFAGVVVLEVIIALPLPWTRLFPQDDPRKVELMLDLLAILAPYALSICVVAFLAGVHQARSSFAIPAAMPITLNLVWIVVMGVCSLIEGEGALAVLDGTGVRVVSWAILGTGIAQVAMVYVPVRRHAPLSRLSLNWRDPHVRQVLALFLPMTLGLGIYQINLFLDRVIAEALIAGDGAITALYFGDRMMQFPQALIGVALATAAFPRLSRLVARGDQTEFAAVTISSLRVCLSTSLAAAVGLALVAEPAVELLFAGPAFDAEQVSRTVAVIQIVSVAVVATSILQILLRAHYALGNARLPLIAGVIAVVVNLTLNLTLVHALEERGLALATVLSTALNATLLTIGLRRYVPELDLRPLARLIPRMAVVCVVMGLVVWAARDLAVPEGAGRGLAAARLLLPMFCGVAVFVVLAPLAGFTELASWIARRAGRPRAS